jgi:hypothetical protein
MMSPAALDSRIRLIAAIGLVTGAVLGMAGAFAPSAELRALAWGVDGTALVVAAALLAMHYFRRDNDLAAAGFLVFTVGEAVILSGVATTFEAGAPLFAAGVALWSASLALVGASRVMPRLVSGLGDHRRRPVRHRCRAHVHGYRTHATLPTTPLLRVPILRRNAAGMGVGALPAPLRQGSERWGRVLFVLVLIVCLLQARKAIDFGGYWHAVRASMESGFHRVPYPAGDTAVAGDYFQSPVTTFLLIPWSVPPEKAAKLLWSFTNLLLVAWLLRVWVREPQHFSHVLFFVMVFAHGLSDVFLSGNINFPLLALLVAGWTLMDRPSTLAQAVGAICLAIAVYIKVVPLILLGFFVLTAQWKKAGYLIGALVVLLLLTWVALPAGTSLPWWQGWLHALGLYDVATGPERVSYQSPPAAVFRLLDRLTGLPRAQLISVMNAVAATVTAGLLGMAVMLWRRGNAAREWVFPVLLAPSSWAGPTAGLSRRSSVFPWYTSRHEMVFPAGLDYGRHPYTHLKEIWPKHIWNEIAYWSLPATCLAILMGNALAKSVRPQMRVEVPR